MFVGMLLFLLILPAPPKLNGCVSVRIISLLAVIDNDALALGFQFPFLAVNDGRFFLSSGSVDSVVTEPSCSLIFDIAAGFGFSSPLARPRRCPTLFFAFEAFGGGGGRAPPLSRAVTPILIPMRRGPPPMPEDDTPVASISG